MRSFIGIFILLASSVAFTESVLELPAEPASALTKWNANFVLFKRNDYSPAILKLFKANESPAIYADDFNGDQKKDFAVLGEKGKDNPAIVAILSRKENDKFDVVEVEAWSQADVKNSDIPVLPKAEKGVPMYLSSATGPVAEKYKRINKQSAIQVQGYKGAIRLFAIRHGKPLVLVPE